RIDRAAQAGMAKEALQLRGEDEIAVLEQAVVERLLAEAVAGEKEGLGLGVPKGEGEHAVEPVEAGGSPFLPRVHDRLGVASGAEAVAARAQLAAERLEIVDLAVEHDGDAAVLVVERLRAARDIDDGEPAMAEAQARLEVIAGAVGTAVAER